MRKRIAIVGGGVAGLTAGHLLHRDNDVTLFEKTRRIGGNAYTYDTKAGYEVDIAVAAFGKAGYPAFYELVRRLGARTQRSPGAFMSMRNLDTRAGLYITPWSARGLVRQRFALLRPGRVLELAGLVVALRRLQSLRRAGRLQGLTLAQAIDLVPELRGEARLVLLCALCLMSSMSGPQVLAAPADFFAGKLAVHNDVISPRAPYSIHCMANRTRSYVDALARGWRDRIVLGAVLRSVLRDDEGVTVVDAAGDKRRFDEIVLACHADEALRLIEQPTEREAAVLGAWRYKDSHMVVHTDHSSFPPRELIQAFTFLYRGDGADFDTSVSGALWRLPGVTRDSPYISTQHANFPIDESTIEHEVVLRTPIFDFDAVASQRDLPALNGVRHSYYCGSHFGHGLHEDAVVSAIAAARQLGASW